MGISIVLSILGIVLCIVTPIVFCIIDNKKDDKKENKKTHEEIILGTKNIRMENKSSDACIQFQIKSIDEFNTFLNDIVEKYDNAIEPALCKNNNLFKYRKREITSKKRNDYLETIEKCRKSVNNILENIEDEENVLLNVDIKTKFEEFTIDSIKKVAFIFYRDKSSSKDHEKTIKLSKGVFADKSIEIDFRNFERDFINEIIHLAYIINKNKTITVSLK